MNEEKEELDAEVQELRKAIRLIADGVHFMQSNLNLNKKGFYILLSYYSKLPQKTCRTVVDSIFQLEDSYFNTGKKE